MKVWVFPSWYPPNGGYFFREHSQALCQAGAEVTLMAGLHSSLKDFPLLRPLSAFKKTENISGRFHEITWQHWNIPFMSRASMISWIKRSLSMAEAQMKESGRPWLIQAHSAMWAGVVAARLGKRHQIPWVITEHRSRFVFNSPQARSLFSPWHHPLLKEAFSGAAAIVTVSEALNDKILQYAPEKAGSIRSIPNITDVDFFTPCNTRRAGAASNFTFFSLAHHLPVKGLDTLLNAFALVQEKMPQTRLVLGGHGPLTTMLHRQCQRLKLEKVVRFTGPLNRQQVKQELQQADAFVLPSHFEAFGVVFIEAMACGLPVIAARAGGPETFITPYCGLLVNPGQPVELSKAMMQIIQQPQKYSHEVIRDYTVKNFSQKAIAGRYINLYREILQRK